MRKNLRFVGLDVHKDSISVAVAENGREPARLLETVPADEWLLLKVLDRLGPKSRLRVCYEAGPTGYGLARRLNQAGICCVVVAPSLVPTQKNRRIKTDAATRCGWLTSCVRAIWLRSRFRRLKWKPCAT